MRDNLDEETKEYLKKEDNKRKKQNVITSMTGKNNC